MNEEEAVTKHWAVLIGINFYVKPQKHLEGCVRDVESIKQYLEALSTPVHVSTFTASTPVDPDSRYPAEKLDSWPTFENVTSRLAKITAEAKPGDFVYVHYSGHGAQTKATASEYSNKNTGDLALVLFDDIYGSRYLLGLTLAHLLNEMVQQGLFVTLVLDCCFSGSVIRHGDPNSSNIRTVDYDPVIDAAYPQEFATNANHWVTTSTLRDAYMLPTWLVDPNGYTILSACGPHEKAKELTLEDGQKHGALSYFLLCALGSLRNSGVEITHQSLHQHLCVKFHAHWPQQRPMRYGNKNLSFFGKLKSGLDMTFVSVLRAQKDHRLCLQAGLAHGVCKEDEYALYPLNSSEDILNNVRIKARVTAVRGLTSDLVGFDPTSVINQVNTGWKARPLTHLYPHRIPVRLMDDVGNQDPWMPVMEHSRFLCLSTKDANEQPCLYSIKRNERNEFEILDGSSQKIDSLPTVPSDMEASLGRIVDLLEHLATFKYIEGIINRIPQSSFEHSFEVHLNAGLGNDLKSEGFLEVKHDDFLTLTVQNLSKKSLYLTIFDLGPSWQIESLLCNSGGGDFKVVLPKNDMERHTGKETIKLQMSVPDAFRNRGQHQCEDILKVFVTSRPSSFAALVLPRISLSPEDMHGRVRGNYNRLSRFLSGLATPSRGAEDNSSDEEWAARNFVVRTVAEVPCTQGTEVS